jgi:UDP:flavonoid glycosyltransferase YjiC (YdhE family)
MSNKKILFVSGSLGLGHVTRDLAIANELRNLNPNIEIEWLAVHPASLFLENAGEKLVPEASEYSNENDFAESSADGSKLNLLIYLLKSKKAWEHNTKVFTKIVTSKKYDLVIGDETYEISLALRKHQEIKNFPFVMIFDFVGLDSMTSNPLEKLGVHIYNSKWSHDYRKKVKPSYDLGLFVGELEDIPNKSFGLNLPNRRVFAKAMYNFIGYIFPFDPAAYINKNEIRKKLGYGPEPLIIASVGGTSIGKELLEKCGEAYSLIKDKIPSLQMLLVAGPRIEGNSLKLPDGIEVKQFIPKLYEHFAACDLAIVQGGATSTLELTALQKPFLYFPLADHSEQEGVAKNLSRRGAGSRMNLSQTTSTSLAEKISSTINSNVMYPKIPTDGAHKAAELILNFIK